MRYHEEVAEIKEYFLKLTRKLIDDDYVVIIFNAKSIEVYFVENAECL